MRFSLRTILLVFLLVGLALATLLSTWKLYRAEQEIERVRQAYGVGGHDRYQMNSIGEFGPNFRNRTFFHLIRLDAPEDYRLVLNFYDGATQQLRQEEVPLTEVDHTIAIWQDTNNMQQQLNVQSIQLFSRIFSFPLNLQGNQALDHHPGATLNGTLDESPFLIYAYYPPDSDDQPNFQWIGLDVEKLTAWCDKYQTQCVYFKLEPVVK